jgi:hypothetical protein
VLKGHKGFSVTKEEVANGISAAEFMHGFVVDEETGMFEWIEVHGPALSYKFQGINGASQYPPNPLVEVEPQLPVPMEVQLPIPQVNTV